MYVCKSNVLCKTKSTYYLYITELDRYCITYTIHHHYIIYLYQLSYIYIY
jgi:hypothetical protein